MLRTASDPHEHTFAAPCLPLQSYSFNYMGQKLGRRVRVLMFAALLRQVGGGCGTAAVGGWVGGWGPDNMCRPQPS